MPVSGRGMDLGTRALRAVDHGLGSMGRPVLIMVERGKRVVIPPREST